MKRHDVLLLSIAAPALTIAALLTTTGGRTGDGPARERARICHHLARVERTLRARNVGGWPAEARRARAVQLDRLHDYWTRCRFPHNHDFPGQRVTLFVDEHGTRCAVAWLIERSGRPDVVARVASTRNRARVRELAADPDLNAWLRAAGLTLAEAALIQPEYGYEPRRAADESHVALASTLVVTSAVEIWIIAANQRLDDPWVERRGRGAVGFLGGVFGAGVGLYGLSTNSPSVTALGALTTLLSGAAAGFSIRNLSTHPPEQLQASRRELRPGLFVRTVADEPPQLAVQLRF